MCCDRIYRINEKYVVFQMPKANLRCDSGDPISSRATNNPENFCTDVGHQGNACDGHGERCAALDAATKAAEQMKTTEVDEISTKSKYALNSEVILTFRGLMHALSRTN